MIVFSVTFLNLLAILHFPFTYCYPGSPTYVSEGGRLDINIEDLDTNINKACERMRSLDKVLSEMYKDPPQNGGEDMNRLSRTYNQACLDLLYFTSLDKMKTLKAAQDILDYGGPQFFDVDMDEEKLKEKFQWDDEWIEGLYIIRKKTHEVWYDLWQLYRNLPN